MCTVVPGIGSPTVPYRVRSGGLAVAAAVDSVSPYPSYTVTPAPSKNSPSRRSIPEPPDMACRIRPPIASRTFRYTTLSKNWCCIRSPADGPGPVPKARASSASAYFTAMSTALSNGPIRPSDSALRREASKTFSKMYGTARMNVGRNVTRSGISALADSSGWWPSFTRPRIAATSTIRPKTWASGRKSRVAASSPGRERKTGLQRATMVSVSNMKWACVSTQPLGRPVVPEV